MQRAVIIVRRWFWGGRKRWRRGKRRLSGGSDRYERAKRGSKNWSKQLTSENGHSIRDCLKNTVSRFEKKWKCILLDLVVSTRPLWHSVRIHAPSCFFDLSSFAYWVGRRLPSSLAPALPASQTQFLSPTQFLPLPPRPPQAPSKKTLTRLGSPTQSIPLHCWTGELPHSRWHWHVHCCVEGACGLGCGVGWRGGAGRSVGGIYFLDLVPGV